MCVCVWPDMCVCVCGRACVSMSMSVSVRVWRLPRSYFCIHYKISGTGTGGQGLSFSSVHLINLHRYIRKESAEWAFNSVCQSKIAHMCVRAHTHTHTHLHTHTQTITQLKQGFTSEKKNGLSSWDRVTEHKEQIFLWFFWQGYSKAYPGLSSALSGNCYQYSRTFWAHDWAAYSQFLSPILHST